MEYFHSVTLDEDKCKGCINCVKRCPTEAIRVINGKATIIKDRCIDCGECIRICPHRAKKANYDGMETLNDFEYKIALVAPSFYGQFKNLDNVDYILCGLLDMGFDDIFEVASSAEIIREITRMKFKNGKLKKPVISTACPAIVRMISIRFPELIENLLKIRPPVEAGAILAKERAAKKTGLPINKIGTYFISPCPAKVTAAKNPIGTDNSYIDRVLSAASVYKKVLPYMKKITDLKSLQKCGITGISWSYTGGEATALLQPKYLAVDGMENVIKVLEELEDEKLKDIDFIELNACISGCVGGCLNIENPYVSITKIRQLRKYLPVSENRMSDFKLNENSFDWEEGIKFQPIMRLDNDRAKALEMMQQIDRIYNVLPQVDCAACGAPSCRAFAEDVVKGDMKINDCVFIMKKKLREIIDNITNEGR